MGGFVSAPPVIDWVLVEVVSLLPASVKPAIDLRLGDCKASSATACLAAVCVSPVPTIHNHQSR